MAMPTQPMQPGQQAPNLEEIGVFQGGEAPAAPMEGQPEQAPDMMQPDASGVPPLSTPSVDEENQMRADIDKSVDDLKQKEGDVNTRTLIAKNRIRQMRMNVLEQVFKDMQAMGIDPGDQESVKQFLDQVGQDDPDLLQLFQTMFDSLTADDSDLVPEAPAPEEQAPMPNPEDDYKLLDDEEDTEAGGQPFDLNAVSTEQSTPSPSNFKDLQSQIGKLQGE